MNGMELYIGGCDFLGLKLQFFKMLWLYVFVFLAMVVDFITGIRNAKRQGRARTSEAFRRSVVKFNQYYFCLFLLSLGDVAKTISDLHEFFGWKDLPILTFLGTTVIILIEFKSVFENVTKQAKARDLRHKAVDSTAVVLDLLFERLDKEKAKEVAELLFGKEQKETENSNRNHLIDNENFS